MLGKGSEGLLCERFVPSFTMGNLAQRLAFLLTFPDGLGRIAKRKDREDGNLFRYAQQGIDALQIVETDPV